MVIHEVNMVLNVHRDLKAYYGRGEGGGGGGRGKMEVTYLSLHCHHQNDSCIKMGSDESHFNVVRDKVTDKVTRQRPQTTTFLKKKDSRSGIEPRFFCLRKPVLNWANICFANLVRGIRRT